MSFAKNIQAFNAMYKLPTPAIPTFAAVEDPIARLKAFKNILAEELDEIDEVIAQVEVVRNGSFSQPGEQEDLKVKALTSLADLLGDIQVYCASEMAKFGLPLEEVLEIIMQSNLSKLGADGQPIYDERGKVQKGPNYYRPEPEIQAMLIKQLQG